MYLTHGQPVVYRAAADKNVAILHYHRPDGNYEGWGLHLWGDVATPTEWGAPLRPAGEDGFGVYFRIPLTEGAKTVSYIIHKGDEKDLPDNQSLDLPPVGHEAWRTRPPEGYLLPQPASQEGDGPTSGIGGALDRPRDRRIGWSTRPPPSTTPWRVFSAKGDIAYAQGDLTGDLRIIRLNPGTLTDAQKAEWPRLAPPAAFTVEQRDARPRHRGPARSGRGGRAGRLGHAADRHRRADPRRARRPLREGGGPARAALSGRDAHAARLGADGADGEAAALRRLDGRGPYGPDAPRRRHRRLDRAPGQPSWKGRYYLYEVDGLRARARARSRPTW